MYIYIYVCIHTYTYIYIYVCILLLDYMFHLLFCFSKHSQNLPQNISQHLTQSLSQAPCRGCCNVPDHLRLRWLCDKGFTKGFAKGIAEGIAIGFARPLSEKWIQRQTRRVIHIMYEWISKLLMFYLKLWNLRQIDFQNMYTQFALRARKTNWF